MYYLRPYFFIALMWKKQASNACFNLFLVLLLSPDSVADYVPATAHKVLFKKYLQIAQY